MTPPRHRRAAAVLLVAALSVAALAACDPVAFMRKSPQERAAESRSATASPSPAGTSVPAVTAACGASATPGSKRTTAVAYDTLSRREGFTQAAAAAGAAVIAVGRGTVSFQDFVPAGGTTDGGVLGPQATGMIGAGEASTVFQVAPHSSTRAAEVPTTFPQTNQLDVLRVTGAAAMLRGFTVRGTPEGHLYNGLRIDRIRGLRASDIRVTGIAGSDSRPPGETFGINDYRTVGSRWARIDVDGAHVGGAGFGVNGSRDISICDTTSHDNAHSMGFAFWQSSGIRLTDCSAVDNGFSGFNFERVSGSNTLVRPTASGNRYAMRIASDLGSAKFRIVDPVLTDGHWTVTLPKRFYGASNKQRVSDITLIVHGRSRPDLLRIERY